MNITIIKEIFIEYTELIIVFTSIITYLIIDFFLRRKNKQIKEALYKKYSIIIATGTNISDIENIDEEDQLNYYKNKNLISFFRFWIAFFLIAFYILHKLPNFFSFFAIAVWAIIITFKEIILCFIWFFYISTQYKIWDEIVLTDWKWEIRWEIIYLNILNIWLVGRDENGENNGQFYRIPNYKFFNENIKREDISLHSYKKEIIIINFCKDDFNIDFWEFLENFCSYLDEKLPKRTIHNVWNFKTFIWHKYKLRFSYEKEFVQIKIHYIVRPKNISEIEKSIFTYVEWLKK